MIEELDELSARSYRLFKGARIDTIGDLIAKSEAELMGIPGFRNADLAEVKEVLSWYGFTLKN
ncbi:MAG: DNA-directed RNA polymerase subunit alpha C-terminal domain-containing protein [bacterium]|nr:DNA-directed RNA polymerase subunit alpha C-terminal domain-containing protein [bacterium]